MDKKKDAPVSFGRALVYDMILNGAPEWAKPALEAAQHAANEAATAGFPDFSFTFRAKNRRQADAISWWLQSNGIQVIIITPIRNAERGIDDAMQYNCSALLPVYRNEWHDGE